MQQNLPRGSSSGNLTERANRVMVRGNTRSTVFVPPHPPYAAKGEGCHVTDAAGHKVIDANNNYTALIHGHSDPDIGDAVRQQLTSGTAFGLPTEVEVQLAELLAQRTGYERWRFSNSGTEAVMTAIRAARAATGRDMVLRFEGSYHGTSDPVVAQSAAGITAGNRQDVIVLPQGDWDAFDEAMAQHGRNIAAVLIDLMPNRAGLQPASHKFVRHVREVTQQLGVLLIVDEVITLRIALGGLTEEYSITPDLVTVGKIIGGGFPVGAVGGPERILKVFDPLGSRSVGWGGTFSANPISMIAGKVALEKFGATRIEALNAKGEHLKKRLEKAGVRVAGRGSLVRITEQLPADDLWWSAYERGLLIGTNGLIALSTPMNNEHISEIARISIAAVKHLKPSAAHVSQGVIN